MGCGGGGGYDLDGSARKGTICSISAPCQEYGTTMKKSGPSPHFCSVSHSCRRLTTLDPPRQVEVTWQTEETPHSTCSSHVNCRFARPTAKDPHLVHSQAPPIAQLSRFPLRSGIRNHYGLSGQGHVDPVKVPPTDSWTVTAINSVIRHPHGLSE